MEQDPQRSASPAADADDLDAASFDEAIAVIDRRQVRTLFQPIVALGTQEPVGFEALARGPQGSRVESPLALLAAARAAGRLAELDWLLAVSAYHAAQRARLHPSMSVFLNVEPSTLLTPCPDDLLQAARLAQGRLRLFVEVKEDSLIDDPGVLFDALAEVRRLGWGVAVDNAAASPSSLSLFPLVEPDVVKVDLRGVRGDDHAIAAMSDGARLYAEQTGARILFEGIETSDDLPVALAGGARFGQGWHFGRPTELGRFRAVPREVIPILERSLPERVDRPLDAVEGRVDLATAEQRVLYPLARHLVEQSASHGPPSLLLVSFSGFTYPPPDDLPRLVQAVRRAAYAVVVGPRSDAALPVSPRVRHLPNEGNLAREWTVIVLGPHYAAALLAHDLGDTGDHGWRRFRFAITHDRDLVRLAARSFIDVAGLRSRTSEITAEPVAVRQRAESDLGRSAVRQR